MKFCPKLRKEDFPEPVALSEELINSLSGEQKQILFKLSDLAEEERKLIEEINARRPTPSGALRLSDGSITLCKDEDDWKVITLDFRQELKRVREEIIQNLNKSLDCGLAYLEIIQRQCANYKVKV